MKHLYSFFFLVLFAFPLAVYAQLSYGGEPAHWDDKRLPAEIAFVDLPAPDREALAAEDAVNDLRKDAPWRFGVEHAVTLTPHNSGVWTDADEDGYVRWYLGLHCPEATSVSLVFGTYDLRKGEELYVWSADRSRFLGMFDARNNSEEGVFPVGLLNGDRVVIELRLPASQRGDVRLGLSQVIHGYRFALAADEDDERGPFGTSGACNINVNCPQGADWQVEKRSVALIQAGGGLCTGAMVNNTAQDGTPYFLTANHCVPSNAVNLNSWVFYFNHESTSCSGNTGPTNQSIGGAVVRARRSGSDFALLQLNSTPPTGWNVQYAGWDRSDNTSAVTSAVGIHHPSGDVKKICFDNNAPFHATQFGAAVWYINQWEAGVTEGGSSGSPLFNQNHRIIGQLYGGAAACSGSVNNGQPDWYGRFGVSWATGSSAAQRLKEWLDPLNLNPVVLDGYPVTSAVIQYDASLASPGGASGTICASQVAPTVQLTNNGATTLTSCVIQYQLNGGPVSNFNWSGSLAQGQQTTVNLPALNVSNGQNTLVLTAINPNGQSDQDFDNNSVQLQFNAFTGAVYDGLLTITLDNYPQETSWVITQNGQTIYSSGGTYSNQADGTELEIPLCFAQGCYTLVMQDSQGDGLCCQYGQGSYQLTNNFGDVVAQGAQFGSSQTTTFCMSPTSVEEQEGGGLLLYPNPAAETVRILHTAGGRAAWKLYDVSGRLAGEGQLTGERQVLDVSGYSEGYYTFTLLRDGQAVSRPLVIRR
jgi:lysyl endopeptidase